MPTADMVPLPCLIGGTGRSGTSLLGRIFDCHPGIAGVPEMRFLIDPDGLLDLIDSAEHWSPFHADTRIRRLARMLRSAEHAKIADRVLAKVAQRTLGVAPVKVRRPYRAIGAEQSIPGFGDLVDDFLAELTGFAYRGDWEGQPFLSQREVLYSGPRSADQVASDVQHFLARVMAAAAQHAGVEHYLEKNTWNALWFDKILRVLPEARLVHIVRDPRDVVASYSAQAWAPTDLPLAIKMLGDLYTQIDVVLGRCDPTRVMQIKLEDVVSDPTATLTSVCEFWNLPWSDSLLETELSSASFGKWTTALTPDEQAIAQDILGGHVQRLGYPSS